VTPSATVPNPTAQPNDTQIVSTQIPPPVISSSDVVDVKGIPMVLVPAGEFTMGSENGFDDEKPSHKVYLNAFLIDIYEVTNKLYKNCVDEGVCRTPYKLSSYSRNEYYGNQEYESFPVIFVDWNMADTFCAWREARLPTEAEWEKAARGTNRYIYPWGNEFDWTFANVNNNDTTAVGSYEKGRSPYGLYDMIGNVWEWVADWYSDTYYLNSPLSNPFGPAGGPYRVLRGGSSLDYDLSKLRVSYRGGKLKSLVDELVIVGFRCARDLSP